jgi:hypothetical protein
VDAADLLGVDVYICTYLRFSEKRVLDPLPVLSEPLWPVGPEIFLKRCPFHGLGELSTARQMLPLGLS